MLEVGSYVRFNREVVVWEMLNEELRRDPQKAQAPEGALGKVIHATARVLLVQTRIAGRLFVGHVVRDDVSLEQND